MFHLAVLIQRWLISEPTGGLTMIDRKFVATVLAAGLVFAASATPALAQDEAGAVEARTPIAGTAADYGQMPAYELVEVSPSGDRLAYVTVAGEERGLLIVEQATGQLLGGARLGAAKLRDIRWIDDDHILTVITATERGNISLSLPGSRPRPVL